MSITHASAALTLGVGTSAAGQSSLQQALQEPDSCEAIVAAIESANALRLFRGTDLCMGEGRELDATLLLLLAQERSIADMSTFLPAGETAKQTVGELYGFIFYRAGGMGRDEFYRDPAQTAQLLDRFRDWRPRLAEGYDPGWGYRENPRLDVYQTLIDENRARRLVQIERQIVLLRDDEYYQASSELQAIQARNTAIVVDSEDGRRHQQLLDQMREIGERLLPPAPKFTSAIAYEYRPDPNAPFRQIHMGVNGWSRRGTAVFESRDSAIGSWLSRALDPDAVQALLAEIDFEQQVLVAYHHGEAATSTGRIYLEELQLDTDLLVSNYSVRVGVIEAGCAFARTSAYPFVLAVFDRSAATPPGSTSSAHANFADGCRPPAADFATDP